MEKTGELIELTLGVSGDHRGGGGLSDGDGGGDGPRCGEPEERLVALILGLGQQPQEAVLAAVLGVPGADGERAWRRRV